MQYPPNVCIHFLVCIELLFSTIVLPHANSMQLFCGFISRWLMRRRRCGAVRCQCCRCVRISQGTSLQVLVGRIPFLHRGSICQRWPIEKHRCCCKACFSHDRRGRSKWPVKTSLGIIIEMSCCVRVVVLTVRCLIFPSFTFITLLFIIHLLQHHRHGRRNRCIRTSPRHSPRRTPLIDNITSLNSSTLCTSISTHMMASLHHGLSEKGHGINSVCHSVSWRSLQDGEFVGR
mmetsp:Transcript_1287/g.3051  ORF Transcript_1287/g.3051 Transcript_1287/m.3051 type:complete len:232 (-) Transcript_1287:52-747(-)